ncbi:hypothetical protein EDB81DRAFT_806703 [Dactylonectria macrodidyma]|uniref:MYND-type domain-containing protein n=1 Tax=Dactylonectria macrodidyma TaxID=307937 RepID=A0A9P9DH85_9HYPO|nr:hypothetical protein EDB81DRAFT_815103 [Dactylonectria macrodidyma]KAH7132874.1 hypothetical protein EDB81DRAFT_806703 [Dactylonectria macrodidyma]
MATCPVRFQFSCDNIPEGLNFTHEISKSLVRPLSHARQDDSYAYRFQRAVLPFLKEHEPVCRAASNPFCGICGSPIATVLQTPMSFLHKEGDPYVGVLVSGTRQAIQEEMFEVGAGAEARVGAVVCAVCGKMEGIRKCGRCKAVAYCGKEH